MTMQGTSIRLYRIIGIVAILIGIAGILVNRRVEQQRVSLRLMAEAVLDAMSQNERHENDRVSAMLSRQASEYGKIESLRIVEWVELPSKSVVLVKLQVKRRGVWNKETLQVRPEYTTLSFDSRPFQWN